MSKLDQNKTPLFTVLKDKEVEVAKTLVGNYMTSLDMGGFSITLLKLDNEMEELLNAEEDTIAF